MEIKSTWHRVTRPDVLNEFEYILNKAREKGLFYGKFARYECRGLYTSSARTTHNIGMCHTSQWTREWCVTINPKLLDCPLDKIREVLVHEIAHACCPTDNHNWSWHYRANLLGQEWGYDASRLCYDKEITDVCCTRKPRIYAIQCPKCGTTWKYKIQCKAVKYPQLYFHRKCGTYLVRVEL